MRGPQRPPERIDLGDLVLRRWTPADAGALLSAVHSSWDHLRPWMAWAKDEPTLETQQGFIRASVQGWHEGTHFEYAVVDGAGEVVAAIGLMARIGPGALEVGYWVRADRQTRGIASRAARAVTDAAFTLPGIERVEIHCDEANLRSAAVPLRLGFRLVATRTREREAPAERGREMVWRATREEWPQVS